ncbi:hypothetical protein VNO77_33731 [Canavalia gladiata]|uniref:Uncharacterized protein n=1 Tax=Canavalia gladiata TaxID=3824 RepID=A0AAN9KCY6_CANGL
MYALKLSRRRDQAIKNGDKDIRRRNQLIPIERRVLVLEVIKQVSQSGNLYDHLLEEFQASVQAGSPWSHMVPISSPRSVGVCKKAGGQPSSSQTPLKTGTTSVLLEAIGYIRAYAS